MTSPDIKYKGLLSYTKMYIEVLTSDHNNKYASGMKMCGGRLKKTKTYVLNKTLQKRQV